MHVTLCGKKHEVPKRSLSVECGLSYWLDNQTTLCYHDLKQSKTVVQINLQEIFCCDKISYIVAIAQQGISLFL